VAFRKVAMGCEKAAAGKAEGRLVRGAVKL